MFVLEPAQGLACKTARKGTGNWRIDVAGRAAHAGVDFEKGANALVELARAVQTVSGWTDLKRGLTVSVGVAGGGTKLNVIPAEAWAEVDVRIARKADGPRMERKFAGLKAVDKRCTLTVTGGINRPPMERLRGTVRLYREGESAGRGAGLYAGGSRDRRSFRRKLYRGAGSADAGWPGRCGRGRACTARVGCCGASGAENGAAGGVAGKMTWRCGDGLELPVYPEEDEAGLR